MNADAGVFPTAPSSESPQMSSADPERTSLPESRIQSPEASGVPGLDTGTSLSRAATVNPCRLCAPLGASLAIRGVKGGVPILHGAQGCATYIRRYLISHFREPVDIASSSFGESAVVFGGERRLFEALDNVRNGYDPEVLVVATTCLAETIGDDPRLSLPAYRRSRPDAPPVLSVSTPSYRSGHGQGFRDTVRALVEAFSPGGVAADGPASVPGPNTLAVLPPMVSPADLRYLQKTSGLYGLDCILAPDYSQTMDGGAWGEYRKLPDGGTPAEDWRALPSARSCLELGDHAIGDPTAGRYLAEEFGVERNLMPLPIGMEACDRFHRFMADLSGTSVPAEILEIRSRVVDAYADAHKYLFGKKVAIVCGEHLAPALARFVSELGMELVVLASGSGPDFLSRALDRHPLQTSVGTDGVSDRGKAPEILDDADFLKVEAAIGRTRPDLVLSSSKAYRICREAEIPLLRVDFPVHDRFGGPRLLNLGYRGTARLLDEIVNKLLEKKQADSPVGFSYQ